MRWDPREGGSGRGWGGCAGTGKRPGTGSCFFGAAAAPVDAIFNIFTANAPAGHRANPAARAAWADAFLTYDFPRSVRAVFVASCGGSIGPYVKRFRTKCLADVPPVPAAVIDVMLLGMTFGAGVPAANLVDGQGVAVPVMQSIP